MTTLPLPLHRTLITIFITTALIVPSLGTAITVDGQIDDWGVGGLANKNADYSGVAGTAWEHTAYEGDGFTSPGGGGQNYDLEFAAMHIEGNTLYGVVMSGQRADNGFNDYSPGDIFLYAYDGNADESVVFGIEVGGGTGGVILDSVGLGDAGATYEVNNNGVTTGVTATPHKAGDLVKNPNTIGGKPFDAPLPNGNPDAQMIAGGVPVNPVAAFIYNQDVSLGEHAIIEFAIDLDMLDLGPGGLIDSMVWSPGCGNDVGSAFVSTAAVPEPTGALLMGAGMLVLRLGAFGRRRTR